MAFCPKCATPTPDGANFCGTCGSAIGANPAPSSVIPDTLDYSIQGDNLQICRVSLKNGQEVYAEAGKMVYKTTNVAWDTRMTGQTLSDKLMGALRRTVTGESLFVTFFRADGPGEVGFAGSYPGKIQAFQLAPGQGLLAQRDAFLFAQPSVQLTVALVKKLGTGFFGGEGFILEKLTGPGLVFIHAGGDFAEFTLAAGQRLQVETGNIVAFDDTVEYDIEFVGGVRTAIFGGEGLFLATLTGPGRVVLQSMTLQKLRRELAPNKTGGDSHNAFDALSGFLGGSED
jgi:uncharacterized protein (TIGR00266 family)